MLLPQAKEVKLNGSGVSNNNSNNKMALGKSIKMYLTIFVATTCVYMVLYQYHMSRQPLATNEVIKHTDKSSSSPLSSSFIASYLWSPAASVNTTAMGHGQGEGQIQRQRQRQGPIQLHAPNATDIAASTSASMAASAMSFLSTVSLPLTLSSSSSSSSSDAKSIITRTTTTTRTAPALTSTTTTAATTTTSTTRTTTTTTRTTQKRLVTSGHAQNAMGTADGGVAHKTRSTFIAVSEPPPLYIITPTYRRPEQLAELTRLGYTLKHVVNLLWLVIEDANRTNPLVAHTLDRIGVPYEYLVAPMPEQYKLTKRAKPRGVSNRNRGLDYLRANATEGVLYFADDDNTYDINIFEQMRYTKKVSMWPVGLVTKTGVSSPIIREGKLEGYYDGWIGGRKYPVDMAGFAVSVKFLHERPQAKMPFKPGYEEDGFLRSLAPLDNAEIELLADECREILTWHTQTKKNSPALPLNMTRYGHTNLAFIEKLLVRP
ncbi:galactosylgalactosylxylosylprotein 3-beta-glucuronosyltransferase P isoform X1 [Drosophila sulfurigaster albostrigata]|uniref:galactosylgalactosylxylosylprotein 3-beta-glucuronosyltransferase P isoform X1 n=1 Tax=Drosophila sulfurigaster albostrigata TaxID=89887 RepID=UPI002D21E83E|nr:galactosylgalactosylxylosylprotein 3-beta-glucuronosyltransferase P isoform X1 [Drosophila sulfurigaster albostrigata]XP_062134517.1 galactosylgalactosylxylosylprotein 3-beta-glucuronosyltransferase P isoform X1 [Drosophila sulfurigaster albostrigata]XP_062134519.1 galactosylgalactosylxylosylprotein 3-beta-glucuronosyltransferase P isoform X1 [Drosophila sulfurigaster albostrigata]XP_062134520.1 galactosylgalactosylxylosylprotein 3-beta-glucuronosyltransferase P isoform X1 [Drosophila sulfuri